LLIGDAGIAKDLHCRNWDNRRAASTPRTSDAVHRSKFRDNEGSPSGISDRQPLFTSSDFNVITPRHAEKAGLALPTP
jgi:hypothetical protein